MKNRRLESRSLSDKTRNSRCVSASQNPCLRIKRESREMLALPARIVKSMHCTTTTVRRTTHRSRLLIEKHSSEPQACGVASHQQRTPSISLKCPKHQTSGGHHFSCFAFPPLKHTSNSSVKGNVRSTRHRRLRGIVPTSSISSIKIWPFKIL